MTVFCVVAEMDELLAYEMELLLVDWMAMLSAVSSVGSAAVLTVALTDAELVASLAIDWVA